MESLSEYKKNIMFKSDMKLTIAAEEITTAHEKNTITIDPEIQQKQSQLCTERLNLSHVSKHLKVLDNVLKLGK